MNVDLLANLVFDILQARTHFRPCVDPEKTERFACLNCSTTLEYAYLEQRLYAIRCPKCKTIVLVRERCPHEAASIVGIVHGLDEPSKEV